ncbi:gliding motility protein GldN [Xiashengella succiniciproducens]|jgi:gliding motility associated protien GldN|uniref:Gliding motility protein GldN n=1 Tax=Xiashengella succiniciproducens TaxID=2949635 RepID=A0A9J6ZPZ8_9BACT|nr:gliding motility protein GldN [Alkaliflexus sp. Ai-910]MDI9538035.1 gliding motility protein GldN [Bacteroidota bacterium]URW79647.1 gliding motility protein GldN [Alkaliflexus sp. Ai-910]
MRKQWIYFIGLVVLGVALSVSDSSAQRTSKPIDNIVEKEHVSNKKPVPYPSLREADILWSKRVWRIIDLRERMNLPLYYPITPKDDRYSLISILLYGIQHEGLPVYSINDDEFKIPISYEMVNERMGATDEVSEIFNPETNLYEEVTYTREVRVEEVKQIMVKEVWFFDRNYSRMDVRIIGLCPIREYVDENGEVVRRQTFWINYPEARNLLARYEVFNAGNDAQRRSFDDIFIKRYFGSYIVQEANMYDNRSIESYAVGVDARLESERIKNEIFNFEHDLWEF